MKEIHLIQARHALPFIRLLKQRGAPIKLLAKQAGLPLAAAVSGEGVIGERSLWRFIEYAAERVGDDYFGYHCAKASPVLNNGKFGVMPLSRAISLEDLLEQFFTDAQKESSGSKFRLDKGRHHSWLRRQPIFQSEQASWHVEQYMLQVFIQMIRICTGPEWLPAEIGVSSRNSPQPVPGEWSSTRFHWGRPGTELKIPNITLKLPPATRLVSDQAGQARQGASDQLTIHGLVNRQLASGAASLENAAEELGISSATLKRKLKQKGTTYSEVLEQCRLEQACLLLADPGISVREIAHDLGYRHPSNFTRAFKRGIGKSPQTYRKLV